MNQPILEIEALRKSYGKSGNQTKALDGVAFQVMPGEFLGIMGSSGSGKSTLLNCIAAVIRPDGGRIVIQGTDIQALKGAELAKYRGKEIGYLFQSFELIDNLTGRENILLPLSLHGTDASESGKRLQGSVNQMLYYALLKSACKDYLFETINLSECLEEILEDYRPVLEEKKFRLTISVPATDVFSDRRGLNFLISQLISNSVKYTKPGRNPELAITFVQEKQYGILSVRDNGTGIRSSDLPYIFEKGFTGDSGENRRRATGMGLYLAKEMARDLNLRLEAASEWGKGFEMKIYFPC